MKLDSAAWIMNSNIGSDEFRTSIFENKKTESYMALHIDYRIRDHWRIKLPQPYPINEIIRSAQTLHECGLDFKNISEYLSDQFGIQDAMYHNQVGQLEKTSICIPDVLQICTTHDSMDVYSGPFLDLGGRFYHETPYSLRISDSFGIELYDPGLKDLHDCYDYGMHEIKRLAVKLVTLDWCASSREELVISILKPIAIIISILNTGRMFSGSNALSLDDIEYNKSLPRFNIEDKRRSTKRDPGYDILGWDCLKTVINLFFVDTNSLFEDHKKQDKAKRRKIVDACQRSLELLIKAYESPDNATKVILSCSAIESLIVGKSDQVSDKFASRLSALEAPKVSERSKYYRKYKKMYGVRSRIVHGSECTATREETREMMELACRSLVHVISIANYRRKIDEDYWIDHSQLLDELDNCAKNGQYLVELHPTK